MLVLYILFIYLSSATTKSVYSGDECSISIEYQVGDLKEPQPLVLQRSRKLSEILYPTGDDSTLKIHAGDSIYLACPGQNNYFQKINNTKEIEAICVKKSIFSVNSVNYNFSSLVCNKLPWHNARYVKMSSCTGGYSSMEIGFALSTNFVRTMELCRNDTNYATHYTKFTMHQSIGSFQKKFPRPNRWYTGPYYPKIDVNKQYNFNNQLATLAKILRSTELPKLYLKKSKQFLSRGHLAAKADFIYGSIQSSTFWYLNAAPQWMSFNGGNWNYLEDSIRRFASDRTLNLDVYTGIHGQMTLPDVYGEQQPIYLHVNGTNRTLPVPRFYWKIIHDPQSKRATAFVGLNDPFVKSITQDIYICTDISSTIKWLSWNARDISAGISYACTVDNLRKVIPHIPEFNVVGILV